jgi:hypothetical protein
MTVTAVPQSRRQSFAGLAQASALGLLRRWWCRLDVGSRDAGYCRPVEASAVPIPDARGSVGPGFDQAAARTVPLERYISARQQCLTSPNEVGFRPLSRDGYELVIGLRRGLSLRTLRRLADCKDRAALIERALAMEDSTCVSPQLRVHSCPSGGFGAPTIAMTVPTFSAVTSRKFGGSTSGWRWDGHEAAHGSAPRVPQGSREADDGKRQTTACPARSNNG